MRLSAIMLAALVGCSQQPVAENIAVDAPVAANEPTPTVPTLPFGLPTTVLPKPVLGKWTADERGDCAPANPLRVDISPDYIAFYESRARILTVTQIDPHSWGVDADVTGEGETRRRSFDFNLNENGSLTRVEAPHPDIVYTRCKEQP